MSLPIWTPDALQSEKRDISGPWWRLVEAQHQVSTMKLVDTVNEQSLLEDILEGSKRRFPPECADLDYLLATPFRYDSAYPHGSRFRRAGWTKGVYYAAANVETALAEMAFYRLLFYAESPATPLPANAAEYTAFSAEIGTSSALDLTKPRLSDDKAIWTHPTDYDPCQTLAETERAADIEAILYQSVRDPDGGLNIALLTPLAFAKKQPVERVSWRIRLAKTGIQALCEFPMRRIGFAVEDFAGDPRIAGLLRG
ncbi:RES family NAD+ phosphorylase [Agrobacterium rosae]|uniref:RES family NAD+ phosphorylase n=1 Tax=Agrobacterium rosae TaxID=1972867 RepID=UPI00122F35ED|nr:RES family NAD+ phosphorylase [Agrobacterium rosae]KAA3514302.1 RES domain-containing protein [Agrobacterium rosae]KAA3522968.1 RES domain-containing protein [Agrobacterium rosae]MQB47672.1 RES domain-containing protein [Agrobacterium rosae]